MDPPLPSSIIELLSWHPLQGAVGALAVRGRRALAVRSRRASLIRAVGAGWDDDDLGATAAEAVPEEGAGAEGTGAESTGAKGGGAEGGLASEEGAEEADPTGLGGILSGERSGDGGDAEEGDGENAGEHFDRLGVEYGVLKECGRLLEVNECKS